jgi:uncharacterized protein with PIN domain
MSNQEKDLEERLLEKAKEAIRALLERKNGRQDMTLSEMEELVGVFEHQIRQQVMQEIINEYKPDEVFTCQLCGGKLHNKGKKKRHIVTVRGEVTVERDYYYCQSCQKGYFPPR